MSSTPPLAPDAVIARIDAIILELTELRRLVMAQDPPRSPREPTVARALYGSLGQGRAEEWDAYADWERFDS